MMGMIFAAASYTIIYLGPLTAALQAFLEALVAPSPSLPEDEDVRGPAWTAWFAWKERDAHMRERGAVDLLQRSWFSRVWVFQDLMLSRDPWVQCGRLRLRWDYVSSCLRAQEWEQKSRRQEEIISGIYEAQVKHQMSLLLDGERSSLIDLVFARQGLGASDSYDITFAHFGFAKRTFDSRLAANYDKHFLSLYVDFTLYIIQEKGFASVLTRNPDIPSEERKIGLPSWIPDSTKFPLSRPVKTPSTLKILRWTSIFLPSTGKWSNYKPSVSVHDPPVLAFHGYELNTIVDCSANLFISQIPTEKRLQFKSSLIHFQSIYKRNFNELGRHSDDAGRAWPGLCNEVCLEWRKSPQRALADSKARATKQRAVHARNGFWGAG